MYRSEGMASVEPMLLGSPISPPGMNTSSTQSPFLPAYLMGEPAPMTQSPGGSRLWSASPGSGSPQKCLNRSGSISSPMAQGSIPAFPHGSRFDTRNRDSSRDLLGGRAKEKAGAPPVQGLLETIASPSPMTNVSKLDGSMRSRSHMGESVSFLGASTSTPFGYNTANQTLPGFNQSAQMIGHSAKTPPSPAQVDPFYTQGETIKPDDELDETWVTVFGFPPAATSFVLQQFAQYGSILKHVVATDGNWMHIHFQSKIQAKKALSKNGKVFRTGIMVGVQQCIDKKVMMTSSEAGGTSFLGTPSQGAGSTPIRPLTAAYRAVSSDFSVVPKSNTPQKSQNVLMKTFDVLFGW